MTMPNEINKSGRYKEDKVLNALQTLVTKGSIKDEAFYIEHLGLTINVAVPYVNGTLVQTVYSISHADFQEEINEAIIGAGPTFEEAVMQTAEIFTATALDSLIKALEEREGTEVSISLPKQENKFKLYKGNLLTQGHKLSGESEDFWKLLEAELKRCVGNKKVYLIKIYAAQTGDKVSCECSINGVIYPRLTLKLEEIAKTWIAEGAIYAERQYLTLIQKEESYKPYAFTKKEVESHTMKALLLFRECKTEEDYEKIYEELLRACNHQALAAELLMLIPEIFTEIIFSEVHYGDELMLVNGTEKLHIYKHQLTAYDWIYNVVDRTIRAGYFTKEQVDPIIARSASVYSINDAVRKGSRRENLSVLGVALPVPVDYEIL